MQYGIFYDIEIIAGNKGVGNIWVASAGFLQFLWQKILPPPFTCGELVQTLLWKVGPETVLPLHTNGWMPLMPNSNRQFPLPELFSWDAESCGHLAETSSDPLTSGGLVYKVDDFGLGELLSLEIRIYFVKVFWKYKSSPGNYVGVSWRWVSG